MSETSRSAQEKTNFSVEQYMQENPATIPHTSDLREAIRRMIEERTNGLVVINDERRVVGILSGWDTIQYIVPDYLEDDLHLAAFESSDLFRQRVETLADHHIANFMTEKVHTVKKGDPLMKAATLLSEFHIRQLPVVDDDGKLIGYINRTDIKRAIGDILGFQEKSDQTNNQH